MTFADGAVHEIDLGPVLAGGGVFSPIAADRALFEAARVDEFGAISFPGDVDLDPDMIRGRPRACRWRAVDAPDHPARLSTARRRGHALR